MSTRDMLLDVMSDVDPVFIKEHMARASTTRAQHIRRYAVPAAIYAAACAVVLLVLPHIIGTTPDEPPVKPDVPIVVETVVTGETEEITESVTVTEAETETVTTEAETTEEITVPPPTEYIPEEPVQTEPPVTETSTTTVTTEIQYLSKNFNKYDVRRLTVEDCGAQIVSGCTYNEYYNSITPMCDITFWEVVNPGVSVYRNRYDYTVDTNSGKIISEKKTERDETFKSNGSGAYKTNGQFYYESFSYYEPSNPYNICSSIKRGSPVRIENVAELEELISEIKAANTWEINDENSSTARFIKDLQYFDEEFFESNTLFLDFAVLTSGSISYYLNNISLDDSGILHFEFNLVKPWVMDCMMDGSISAYAFDKEFLKSVKEVKTTVKEIQKNPPESTTEPVKPERPQEPEGMIHVPNAEIPYSYIEYSGKAQLLMEHSKLLSYIDHEPVFSSVEGIAYFTRLWKSSEFADHQNELDKEITADLDYFDETFFSQYDLYVKRAYLGSNSYEFALNSLEINNNDALCVNIDKYKITTEDYTPHMTLYFIAVEKDLVTNKTDVIYNFTSFTETDEIVTEITEYVSKN